MLVCRGAIPHAVCKVAADRLEAAGEGGDIATSFYKWFLGIDRRAPASDYSKLGYTKTEVWREEGVQMSAGKAATELYLNRAEDTRNFLSSVFDGHCPFDGIRKQLDALDGIVCQVERCPASGRSFLPGVVRRMVGGGRRVDGNVHMDTVVPGRLFTVNVYLRVPEGEQRCVFVFSVLCLHSHAQNQPWSVSTCVWTPYCRSHFVSSHIWSLRET